LISKKIHINLINQGILPNGGLIFEDNILEMLSSEFIKRKIQVIAKKKTFNKKFSGLPQYIKLVLGALKYCNASVNVVSTRIAISSIFRNLFSKNKTVYVVHHLDQNDKSKYYRVYNDILFKILTLKLLNVCVVCVSPFFYYILKQKIRHIPVFLVPNLFPNQLYLSNRLEKNNNKILMGQYSNKLHPQIFKLAKKLTERGYYCFFTTLDPSATGKFETYDIKSLSFSEYLNELASSCCSVAFPKINEGWNRMAHESILLGTPVVGLDMGGLGDLLRESDSYIVTSADEAFQLITNNEIVFRTPDSFIRKYDISNSAQYLNPLMEFITQN